MIVAPLIASLTPEALAALPEHRAGMLRYAWDLFARGSQKPPPGDWVTWLYMAGRGAGKTRTASEWIRQRVYDGAQRIALVGRTPADVRDVMIEGDSGHYAANVSGHVWTRSDTFVSGPSGALEPAPRTLGQPCRGVRRPKSRW